MPVYRTPTGATISPDPGPQPVPDTRGAPPDAVTQVLWVMRDATPGQYAVVRDMEARELPYPGSDPKLKGTLVARPVPVMTRYMSVTRLERGLTRLPRKRPKANRYLYAVPRLSKKNCKESNAADATTILRWEADDPLAEELPIQPGLVLESSPGKEHHYLHFSEWIDRDLAKGLLKYVANRFGYDRGACDYARQLRLAGYENPKYDPPPMSRILQVDWDQSISIAEFLNALGITEEEARVAFRFRTYDGSRRGGRPRSGGERPLLTESEDAEFAELLDLLGLPCPEKGVKGFLQLPCPIHASVSASATQLSVNREIGWLQCFSGRCLEGLRDGGWLPLLWKIRWAVEGNSEFTPLLEEREPWPGVDPSLIGTHAKAEEAEDRGQQPEEETPEETASDEEREAALGREARFFGLRGVVREIERCEKNLSNAMGVARESLQKIAEQEAGKLEKNRKHQRCKYRKATQEVRDAEWSTKQQAALERFSELMLGSAVDYVMRYPYQMSDGPGLSTARAKEAIEKRYGYFPEGGIVALKQSYPADAQEHLEDREVIVRILAPSYDKQARGPGGRTPKYPGVVTAEGGGFVDTFDKFRGQVDGGWMEKSGADETIYAPDLDVFLLDLFGQQRVYPFGELDDLLRLFRLKLTCELCGAQTHQHGFADAAYVMDVFAETADGKGYLGYEDRPETERAYEGMLIHTEKLTIAVRDTVAGELEEEAAVSEIKAEYYAPTRPKSVRRRRRKLALTLVGTNESAVVEIPIQTTLDRPTVEEIIADAGLTPYNIPERAGPVATWQAPITLAGSGGS